MTSSSIVDIVFSALPAEIEPWELLDLADSALWEENPEIAIAKALRSCVKLDWDAYIQNNLDADLKDRDPVWHYVRDGVFEGRRLQTRKAKISVIITGMTSDKLSERTVKSVFTQLPSNIEIILVTDSEEEVFSFYPDNASKAVKTIKIGHCADKPQTHMQRKAGVLASSGEYVMFVCAGDTLAPCACETAHANVKNGYDIIIFMANTADSSISITRNGILNEFSYKGASIASREECLKAMFQYETIPLNMSLRLISAPLCKRAFSAMEDECCDVLADLYESFFVTVLAQKIKWIPDKLYNFINGTNSDNNILPSINEVGKIISSIDSTINENKLEIGINQVEWYYIRKCFESIFAETNINKAKKYIHWLLCKFDIINILDYLISNYFFNWGCVADLFSKITYNLKNKRIEHIGIVYERLGPGGIEGVILQMCDLLPANNYELTLFLHEKSDWDEKLPKNINVVYMKPYRYDKTTVISHLQNLYNILSENSVDVMLYHRDHRKALLWETILLHYMGIPVILMEHCAWSTHYWRGMGTYFHVKNYDLDNYENVLKCLDGMLVLSIYAEAYYRARGINAQYIHNPIALPEKKKNMRRITNKIALVCRLSDPVKQVYQTLQAFQEMLRYKPSLKLLIAGSFSDESERDKFKHKAETMGVWGNIHELGWQDDIACLWEEASILISTSTMEAFTLSLLEAQRCGVPAVIYDLAIMPAFENASVITVPQGEYMALAREVLALLDDEQRWLELSEIAFTASLKYGTDLYVANLSNYLNNFQKQCDIHYYHPKIYRRIMLDFSYFIDLPYPEKSF